ncbi:MAG: PhnD/SsuA/transferrin family substrate-binding protein [Rhizobiaceae bacterium]|nr:PhnD/SsuA/transferrin family substrate-binding protein [Rhizobiaceae bacterium]
MTEFIAALPMYDWPETREAVDAQWAKIRANLLAEGIEAPQHLVRRNADMPAVPGGILDRSGKVIAPDPATLPPDDLDLPTLWRHPKLLFGQTCWGPMMQELLFLDVAVLDQPDYSDVLGGAGTRYRSAIVMRRDQNRAGPDRTGDVAPPEDGTAFLPFDRLAGKRLAYNEPHSWSGVLGLQRDLGLAGQSAIVLADQLQTGGHRLSIRAVAEGLADFAAIDCRTWDLARRFEPAADDLQVVGWTALQPGLPYISSKGLFSLHPRIRRALKPPRDVVALRARLLASGIARAEDLLGTSEAQITAIEARIGPLPRSYRSILALLGNGAGTLVRDDTELYLPDLGPLNARSRDSYFSSLQAGVDHEPLPDNAFFISGQQRIYESFVIADGSDDCPVSAYTEDFRWLDSYHSSVWDWIMEIVRDAEFDLALGNAPKTPTLIT